MRILIYFETLTFVGVENLAPSSGSSTPRSKDVSPAADTPPRGATPDIPAKASTPAKPAQTKSEPKAPEEPSLSQVLTQKKERKVMY